MWWGAALLFLGCAEDKLSYQEGEKGKGKGGKGTEFRTFPHKVTSQVFLNRSKKKEKKRKKKKIMPAT
jgi:hypothetical protein